MVVSKPGCHWKNRVHDPVIMVKITVVISSKAKYINEKIDNNSCQVPIFQLSVYVVLLLLHLFYSYSFIELAFQRQKLTNIDQMFIAQLDIISAIRVVGFINWRGS